MNNEKVGKHGTTVMGGLNRAIENMDDIKNAYRKLSVMHSEKLHVDPDNFRVSKKNLINNCRDHP